MEEPTSLAVVLNLVGHSAHLKQNVNPVKMGIAPGIIANALGPRNMTWEAVLQHFGCKVFASTISKMAEQDGYFGERIAATYDESAADMFAANVVDTAVDALAGLAGGGQALEFGIGTGRIALPLARTGVPVHGIDLSKAMVDRLRSKPGGEALEVTIGDFATTRVNETFSVVYLVFNTIMNLTTQAAQVDCFRNAAAHLSPGGYFVIEVMIPQLQRLTVGQSAVPFHVSPTKLAFDVYDVATQAMSSNYFEIVAGRCEYWSIPFRYVWPAELDLMAQLAGLRLRDRWEGWTRKPFTSTSDQHVSIWEKPTA